MTRTYAHSRPDVDPAEWEPLEEHLLAVAERAERFASSFDAAPWGRLAGLWHDLGKYSSDFQAYLRLATGDEHLEEDLPDAPPGAKRKVDHSTAGAQWAFEKLGLQGGGKLLAYVIAGHHTGLANGMSVGRRTPLSKRLANRKIPKWSAPESLTAGPLVPPAPPPGLLRGLQADLEGPKRQNARSAGFRTAFFVRMLFSALVDADFLATESYMNQAQAELRQGPRVSLKEIAAELTAHIDRLGADRQGPVNDCRRSVVEDCRRQAELPPGAFSLTVPTGGGKTLASLEFALRHAIAYGLERVIVAIPFTSVIEQTANVYREVLSRFPREVVLEHHSNLDPKKETPLSRLNAENWDAPIVVTTNVQLLESLYAARTSRSRKLHRLAKSVIVLDEAQTLPVQLLDPSLRALRELSETYGTSIVFCTATQPALNFREDFPIGIAGVREIVDRPEELYRAMQRVRVERLGVLSDEELAGQLARRDQALCVVGSRPYAARLFRAALAATETDEGVYHLSTFMCGEHRSDVLETIRERLAHGRPCRVVSTQLVEAGVDVDFPVVYRALAGLDSIAQAAGRCNREGKRAEGVVYVFDPPERAPAGFLRTAAEATSGLWDLVKDDPLGLESVRKYFEELYWKKKGEWDARRVLDAFVAFEAQDFDFATAEEKFRMIEETGTPVVIPYGAKGRNLVRRLRKAEERRQPPSPADRRLAQRYVVSVFDQAFNQMRSRGCVLPRHDEQYHVLVDDQLYDMRLGIQVDRIGVYEPGGLIA